MSPSGRSWRHHPPSVSHPTSSLLETATFAFSSFPFSCYWSLLLIIVGPTGKSVCVSVAGHYPGWSSLVGPSIDLLSSLAFSTSPGLSGPSLSVFRVLLYFFVPLLGFYVISFCDLDELFSFMHSYFIMIFKYEIVMLIGWNSKDDMEQLLEFRSRTWILESSLTILRKIY